MAARLAVEARGISKLRISLVVRNTSVLMNVAMGLQRRSTAARTVEQVRIRIGSIGMLAYSLSGSIR
jgi:hypothetical protein